MKQLRIVTSANYCRHGLSRDVDVAAAAMARNPRIAECLITHRLPLDAAEEAFASALHQHERVREPFERGRTLLAQGEALRRFRRRGRARETLGEAGAIFEELGARRWHDRAVAELARTGHRETGSSFTATELQVAQLVAAGRTNREVAESLFMSVHTVEAHLTRIYRSLGVRSRTELARVMATRDSDGGDVGDTPGSLGAPGSLGRTPNEGPG